MFKQEETFNQVNHAPYKEWLFKDCPCLLRRIVKLPMGFVLLFLFIFVFLCSDLMQRGKNTAHIYLSSLDSVYSIII